MWRGRTGYCLCTCLRRRNEGGKSARPVMLKHRKFVVWHQLTMMYTTYYTVSCSPPFPHFKILQALLETFPSTSNSIQSSCQLAPHWCTPRAPRPTCGSGERDQGDPSAGTSKSGEPFSLAPASSKGAWWKWAASPDPPGGSNGSSCRQNEFHRISRDSFSKDLRKSPLLWYNLCLGLPCQITKGILCTIPKLDISIEAVNQKALSNSALFATIQIHIILIVFFYSRTYFLYHFIPFSYHFQKSHTGIGGYWFPSYEFSRGLMATLCTRLSVRIAALTLLSLFSLLLENKKQKLQTDFAQTSTNDSVISIPKYSKTP